MVLQTFYMYDFFMLASASTALSLLSMHYQRLSLKQDLAEKARAEKAK